VFNPLLGRYDIAAQAGPDFGSKRLETVEAFSVIITQAPQLMQVIGDLLVKNMPFDDAQEAALRLKRLVPPQALGQGPSLAEQQMQAQLVALGAALKKSLEANAKEKLRLVGKDQLRDIEAYKAETDRMKALADQLPLDPEGLRKIIEQLVQDSLETNVEETAKSAEAEEQKDNPVHPVPGARMAPDGNWYVENPAQPGTHLMIRPKAPGGPNANS